jgi:hypothetical protein
LNSENQSVQVFDESRRPAAKDGTELRLREEVSTNVRIYTANAPVSGGQVKLKYVYKNAHGGDSEGVGLGVPEFPITDLRLTVKLPKNVKLHNFGVAEGAREFCTGGNKADTMECKVEGGWT